jgi:hypothetical protein
VALQSDRSLTSVPNGWQNWVLHVQCQVGSGDKLVNSHSFHTRTIRIITVHGESFAKSITQIGVVADSLKPDLNGEPIHELNQTKIGFIDRKKFHRERFILKISHNAYIIVYDRYKYVDLPENIISLVSLVSRSGTSSETNRLFPSQHVSFSQGKIHPHSFSHRPIFRNVSKNFPQPSVTKPSEKLAMPTIQKVPPPEKVIHPDATIQSPRRGAIFDCRNASVRL